MSFCSYEEAWGSPYEPAEPINYDHVTKKPNNVQLDQNNDYEQFTSSDPGISSEPGMTNTAPLRGSLLGGAIPDEQWEASSPKICEKNDIQILESKFDEKIDRLINSIDKYSKNIRNNLTDSNQTTSWTDILLFVAIGILAIVILDLFFKFGKTIIETKLSQQYGSNFSNNYTPSNIQPQQVAGLSPNNISPNNIPHNFMGGLPQSHFYNSMHRN